MVTWWRLCEKLAYTCARKIARAQCSKAFPICLFFASQHRTNEKQSPVTASKLRTSADSVMSDMNSVSTASVFSPLLPSPPPSTVQLRDKGMYDRSEITTVQIVAPSGKGLMNLEYCRMACARRFWLIHVVVSWLKLDKHNLKTCQLTISGSSIG